MNKLIAAGNLFLKKMDLTDVALLKLCVGALGVLVGLGAARRHKRSMGFFAGSLFAFTLVPLMGKFIRALTDADVED